MTDTPPRSSDAVERVALVGALLPALVFGIDGSYDRPDIVHFTALVAAIIGITAVCLRARWSGGFTLLTVFCIALRDRSVQSGNGLVSDVLNTTKEAILVLLSGQNPYAHTYIATRPPGGPFAYPPGEIVFYGIVHVAGGNLFRVDLACGILALGIIAAFVPICGAGLPALAISAIGWSTFITIRLTDGSNDNAAAFLTLAAFAMLVWSFHTTGRASRAFWWCSACTFGWAIAFKEYTIPIAFFIALYLWRSDAVRARGWTAAMLGTAAAFIVPFFVWNPRAFVANIGGAIVTHAQIWGRNAWHDWIGVLPHGDLIAPFTPAIMALGFAILCVVLWRHPARSLSGALLQGIAALAVTFVLARWTTSVYYCFLAPLLAAAISLNVGRDTVPLEEERAV